MSAIPVLEVARNPRRDYIELAPRPIVVVRPKVVSAPKRKPVAIVQYAVKAGAFAGLVAFSYASSTLFGQVMVEKARRDGLQAMSRMHLAEASEVALQSRLQQIEGDQAISGWASDNHFNQPDMKKPSMSPLTSSKGLVAIDRD